MPPPASTVDAGVSDGGAAAVRYGCVDLCAGVSCVAPQKCDPATGTCKDPPAQDGGGLAPPPTDVPTGDGGLRDDMEGGGLTDADGGCACTSAGLARFSATGMGCAAGLAILFAMRRRRR